MKLKVLCSLAICALAAPFALSQSSPFSNNVFSPQLFTASGQTGTPIQLNGLTSSSTVGSSYSTGVVTLTGTSLTTVTFSVQGSSDNGATYYALPLYSVASPTSTPVTTVTATANGLYQVNLAGLTHVKFVTSGTFNATNVTFTLTATPNGQLARNNSGGGSIPPATSTTLGGVQLAVGQSSSTLAKIATTGAASDLTGLAAQVASMNAGTATALAGAGTDCSTGMAARGVDASGNATGCFTPSGGTTGPQYKLAAFNGSGSGSNYALGNFNATTDVTGNNLTLPGVLLANQPQNFFSVDAYNTGGTSGGANGIANALAASSGKVTAGILIEPDYTEWESSNLENVTDLPGRSLADYRGGSIFLTSINPANLTGTGAANFGKNCIVNNTPGSPYGQFTSGGSSSICDALNYTVSVPGYYYGNNAPVFNPTGQYGTQLFYLNSHIWSASINQSLFNGIMETDGAGDRQFIGLNYYNNYGGGDHASDEGHHFFRFVNDIGHQEFTATINSVTDFPASGYKQLSLNVPANNLGVMRLLIDRTAGTADTVNTIAAVGDGTSTATMAGSTYTPSTIVTLATTVAPPSTNYQTKTSETFTVNTTADLSTSPGLVSFQFGGIATNTLAGQPECGKVTSYGSYNSGAHTQTITAMLSEGHTAGAKLYLGGTTCGGIVFDGDTTNSIKNIWYVLGASANNALIVARWGGGSPNSAFLHTGAAHVYPMSRVLDVRGAGPGQEDNIVKVEESPASWTAGDTVESGLIATQMDSTFYFNLTDNGAYSEGETNWYILAGNQMSNGRDFQLMQNTGASTVGGYVFHWEGPIGGVFRADAGLQGPFFAVAGCGFTFGQNGTGGGSPPSSISNKCAGAIGSGYLEGWDINGDLKLESNGATIATFSSIVSKGINFTPAVTANTTTVNQFTNAVGLTVNGQTTIGSSIPSAVVITGQAAFAAGGSNPALTVNGYAAFNGQVWASGGFLIPGQTNCVAGFNGIGLIGCNIGAISGNVFDATCYNVLNSVGGTSQGGWCWDTGGGGNVHGNFTSGVILEGSGGVELKGDSYGITLMATTQFVSYLTPSVYYNGANLMTQNPSGSSASKSTSLQAVNYTDHVAQTLLQLNDVSGAGALTSLSLVPNGGRATFGGPISWKQFTVATLPASPSIGDVVVVTDATSPTFLGTLTGGGAVKVPAIYNGSAWVSF